MLSATDPCGPCKYDGVDKEPNSWCIICEDGLCDNCEKEHKKKQNIERS